MTYLYEEEAGSRGRVVVDVHGDQHAGDQDERDQQDAQDEADVEGFVRAGDPVHGAVGWHHWAKNKRTILYWSYRYLLLLFGTSV